ncbi:hypothetical protein [Knoellia subterranea]|uniref:N-acetyltransferase domain-containing protein n=1 Tax=Knoellia subterranea KCTC 19937 TaxID=1385521 RepID=A0A0A0JS21_9MICO|nr:hypothetical protein [Knoellia subterranea]KGN38867.1 hypothetical protein N803_07890 [Knoellia subterranea KCTC 19937]
MPDATFPDIVPRTMSRHGVVPARGHAILGHEEALISHFPPEPDRPFVVHWTRSDRDAHAVLDDLVAHLAAAGARSVEWWFRGDSTPPGLEDLLIARGARQVEDQVGLARTVDAGLPTIADGVRVTLVEDRAALDAVVDIGVEVFGDPDTGDREHFFDEVNDELDRGVGAWVVGWLDREPVGRAHVGFEWGVAPLVGAAVLPRARR